MNKFTVSFREEVSGSFFDKVLDSLDVMIGFMFDGFDGGGVSFGEIFIEFLQRFAYILCS